MDIIDKVVEILNLPILTIELFGKKNRLEYERVDSTSKNGVLFMYQIFGPKVLFEDGEFSESEVGRVLFTKKIPGEEFLYNNFHLINYYPEINNNGYISIWIYKELEEFISVEGMPTSSTFFTNSEKETEKNNHKKSNKKDKRYRW